MFIFIVSLFIILASIVNAISRCALAKRGKRKTRAVIDLVLIGTSILYIFFSLFFYYKEGNLFVFLISFLICIANILVLYNPDNASLKVASFLYFGIPVIALIMYGIVGGKLVIDTENKVQDVQYITAINDDYVVLSQYGDNINVLYVVNDNGKKEYINKIVKKEDISINKISDKPCITISTYYYKKIGIFGNEKSLQEIAKEKININTEKEQIINSELLSE